MVTFTISLQDLLVGAGVVLPIACGAMYWALRMAITAAVVQLELKITQGYMQKETCRVIREECERHRHERVRGEA
jgi:hypothetical protein